MTSQNKNIIYPVILKVPEEKRALSGRESVRFLSQYARQAVIASARKSGIDVSILEKDRNGTPMQTNGIFWSLSHKPAYVVGVTAGNRVGIDIELVRPVPPSLVKRIIDNTEQQLADKMPDALFFRYWTAKEAVLKAAGVGLKGLSHCRIKRILDKDNLIVSYDQKHWMIEHACYDNHVVSVVKEDQKVQWCLPITSE